MAGKRVPRQGAVRRRTHPSADGARDDRDELERRAGRSLRQLVLDPLLPTLEGTERLVFVPAGSLHAVPLDALPHQAGRLGDPIEIELRSTTWELLLPDEADCGNERLVALGGLDYDAAADMDMDVGIAAVVVRGPDGRSSFHPLPESTQEVEALTALFGSELRAPVHTLRGSEGTRSALLELAPRARVLHLATHAWAADPAVLSWDDLPPAGLIDPFLEGLPSLTMGESLRASSPIAPRAS